MSGLPPSNSVTIEQFVYRRLRVCKERELGTNPDFAAVLCGVEESYIQDALDAGLLKNTAPNQKLPMVSIYDIFELLERIGHPGLHKELVEYIGGTWYLRLRKDGIVLISTNIASELFELAESELADALRSGLIRNHSVDDQGVPLVSVHEVLACIETIKEAGG